MAMLQEMAKGTPLERIPGWDKIRVSVPLAALAPPPDERWVVGDRGCKGTAPPALPGGNTSLPDRPALSPSTVRRPGWNRLGGSVPRDIMRIILLTLTHVVCRLSKQSAAVDAIHRCSLIPWSTWK